MDRTSLGIIGPVNQAFDAGVYRRPRAHRARFNCSKQLAVSQTMVTDVCTGFAQGDDFAAKDDDGADGDLPASSAR